MESSEQIQTYFWFIRILIVLVFLGILWKVFDSIRNFFRRMRLKFQNALRAVRLNRRLRKLKRIRISEEISKHGEKEGFFGKVANSLFIEYPLSLSSHLTNYPYGLGFICFWIVLGVNFFGILWDPGLAPFWELILYSVTAILIGSLFYASGNDEWEVGAGVIGAIILLYYLYLLILYWVDAFSQISGTEEKIIFFYSWGIILEAIFQMVYWESYGLRVSKQILLITTPMRLIYYAWMGSFYFITSIVGILSVLVLAAFDFISVIVSPTKIPLQDVKIRDIEKYISWKNKQIEWNEFVSVSGGIKNASDIKRALEEQGF